MGIHNRNARPFRLLVGRVAMAAATVLFALAAATDCRALGDANSDGSLDVVDVQLTVSLILALQSPDFPGQGDANGSGTVDATDIQTLVNAILRVPQPLAFLGPFALPPVEAGSTYAVWLPAVGGTQPVSWTYSGALPPGLVMAADGWLTGIPTLPGNFSITVQAVDSGTGVLPLSLSLLVTAQSNNTIPVAVDDRYQARAGIPRVVTAPGVLENDWDADFDTLSVILTTQPQNGIVALDPTGGFTLDMLPTATGSTSFTYLCMDGRGGFATGTVFIVIATNLPPDARDDDYTQQSGVNMAVSSPGVLANDTDPDGQPLSVTLESQALHGTVTLLANGSFTYVPMVGFLGVDEFVYAVSDSAGGTSYATARILMHENPVPPVTFEVVAPEGPVWAAEVIRVVARVWDPANTLPTTNAVQGVTVSGFGMTTPVPMAFAGFTSSRVAVYRLLVPAASLPFGIADGVVTCTMLSTQVLSAPVTAAIHTAPPIFVGTGHAATTIQQGLGFVSPFGAVVLEPGVYLGPGNTTLLMDKTIIVGGRRGLHRTTIVATVGFVTGFTALDAVISGLTIQEATAARAIVIDARSVVHRCRLRDCINAAATGNAEGAAITTTAADFQILECWFRDNQVVALSGSAIGPSIHAVSPVGATVRRCVFWGDEAFAHSDAAGGSVYVRHTVNSPLPQFPIMPAPVTFEYCRFVQCEARSPTYASAGAIGIGMGAWVDVSSSEFWECKALAGAPYNPFEAVNISGYAYGGALYGFIKCQIRIASSKFIRCVAWGSLQGCGGGVGARWSCALTLHNVEMAGCSAWTDVKTQSYLDSKGGGIYLIDESSIRIEKSTIRDCVVNGGMIVVGQGGAVFLGVRCGLEIHLSNIVACQAQAGAAIFGTNAWMVMDQCTVADCVLVPYAPPVPPFPPNFAQMMNVLVQGPGAINFAQGYSVVVEHSVIRDSVGAIGMYHAVSGNSASLMRRISNCLITGNAGGGLGLPKAAVVPTPPSPVTVEFTTIANNGGQYGLRIASGSLKSCIIRNNGSVNISDVTSDNNATHCCVMPTDQAWATDPLGFNITTDPLFVQGPPGPYCLAPTSPCIGNAGTPTPGILLSDLSTRTNSTPDPAPFDRGYHFRPTNTLPFPAATVTLAVLHANDAVAIGNYYVATIPPMLIVVP